MDIRSFLSGTKRKRKERKLKLTWVSVHGHPALQEAILVEDEPLKKNLLPYCRFMVIYWISLVPGFMYALKLQNSSLAVLSVVIGGGLLAAIFDMFFSPAMAHQNFRKLSFIRAIMTMIMADIFVFVGLWFLVLPALFMLGIALLAPIIMECILQYIWIVYTTPIEPFHLGSPGSLDDGDPISVSAKAGKEPPPWFMNDEVPGSTYSDSNQE